MRKKLGDCEREVKRIRFEEALAVPVSELCGDLYQAAVEEPQQFS